MRDFVINFYLKRMVQLHQTFSSHFTQIWQPWITNDEARSLSQHQQQQRQKIQRKTKTVSVDSNMPVFSSLASTTVQDNSNGSGKWKREKKFQHKTTMSVCDSTSNDLKSNSRFPSVLSSKCLLENEAEPLDMSKRATVSKERGEPPSYFQSILSSNYGRRQTSVPAVIFTSSDKASSTTSSSTTLSDDKEAMCDQVINEHFRRSLGRDYLNVFSTNKLNSKNQENERLTETRSVPKKRENGEVSGAVQESRCISPSPLSVDDHFAKALGETWVKLQQQQKQNENQNKNSGRSIHMKHDVDES